MYPTRGVEANDHAQGVMLSKLGTPLFDAAGLVYDHEEGAATLWGVL